MLKIDGLYCGTHRWLHPAFFPLINSIITDAKRRVSRSKRLSTVMLRRCVQQPFINVRDAKTCCFDSQAV